MACTARILDCGDTVMETLAERRASQPSVIAQFLIKVWQRSSNIRWILYIHDYVLGMKYGFNIFMDIFRKKNIGTDVHFLRFFKFVLRVHLESKN